MQKTQNFSCLFRHYAKHNGLRKEGIHYLSLFLCSLLINKYCLIIDLIFTFVDELLSDQTPETVHLMPQGNTKPPKC